MKHSRHAFLSVIRFSDPAFACDLPQGLFTPFVRLKGFATGVYSLRVSWDEHHLPRAELPPCHPQVVFALFDMYALKTAQKNFGAPSYFHPPVVAAHRADGPGPAFSSARSDEGYERFCKSLSDWIEMDDDGAACFVAGLYAALSPLAARRMETPGADVPAARKGRLIAP